ncbi:MAG: DEAD/DEAH box helicase [Balneolaceae bacterium]
MKFTEFNLSDSIQAGLRDLRFEEPTPIQEQAIPAVTEGRDLIATAQTGTGKTGAFVIPIMERVLQSNRKGIKALIVSPTRELASQIDEQIFAIGYHAGITSATVIGGSDFSQQAKALKAGVDIIVATPGRLIDQHKVLNIDFSHLEYFVLDEADRMLDMGFLPDIKKIISWLPEKKQTLLFSATMPQEIAHLAKSIMTDPAKIEIERSKPNQNVEQRAYKLRSNQKIPLVKKIFNELEWDSCIIFTSTKKGTDELQRLLKKEGIKAASIHGDRSQDERNKALQAFRNGQVPVIVATDVLARGIDIKGVSIIVNYDVPNNTDDYIHRIGRTGRYDKSGIAITFVTRRDSRTFSDIERIKGNTLKVIELPDNFGDKSSFSWDGPAAKEPESKSREESSDKRSSGKKESRSDDDQSSGKSRGDRDAEPKKSSKKKQESRSDKPDKRSGGRNKDRNQKRDDRKSDDRSSASDNRPAPANKSKQRESGPDDDSRRSKKGSQKSEQSRQSSSNERAEKPTPQPTPEPAKEVKVVIPPVIGKAAERNKKALKPAKGFWGIVKSMLPKL